MSVAMHVIALLINVPSIIDQTEGLPNDDPSTIVQTHGDRVFLTAERRGVDPLLCTDLCPLSRIAPLVNARAISILPVGSPCNEPIATLKPSHGRGIACVRGRGVYTDLTCHFVTIGIVTPGEDIHVTAGFDGSPNNNPTAALQSSNGRLVLGIGGSAI